MSTTRRRPPPNEAAQTAKKAQNALTKDEELNEELKNAGIPEDLQGFLQTIAIPPESDEEGDNSMSMTQHKRNIKNAKSKIGASSTSQLSAAPPNSRNGSQKKKKKKKPLTSVKASTMGGSADPENNRDSDTDSEEERELYRQRMMGMKKRDPERGRMTEYEIALLYNQFKGLLPNEKVNKKQLQLTLRQIFQKCPLERLNFVVDNFFAVFDRDDSGQVSFRELLIAFCLTMKAPMKDKLNWAYRLYDTEGIGEVDRDELANMVINLAESNLKAENYVLSGMKRGTSEDKEGEEKSGDEEPKSNKNTPTKKKERLTSGRRHQSEDLGNVKVLSSKMNERVGAKKNKKHLVNRTTSEPKKGSSVDEQPQDDESEEVPQNAIFTKKAKERAMEVVKSLDLNRDGYVTQEEFITGCLEDGDFYHLISCFDAVIMLWGELMDT